MNYYSWEKFEKRPWYRRWWFIVIATFLIFATLGGLFGYGYLYYKFANQVEGFDLSKLEKMESASVIYDRNGVEIGKIFIQNRLPIHNSEIPKNIVNAIVAEEDNRFFEHHGVDYFGVLRAAISNYRQGRIKQGASTVTQQLARNSFDLRERSIQRKILEMFLAHRIERHLSKEKIMELYLNRVYFGSGFYGIEAAAMGYFGKHASALNVNESALLAGLLKSPNALSPWNNPKGALAVRDFVLNRMQELGSIDKTECQEALKLPLGVQKRSNPFKVSYAIDLVRQQAIAALGYQRAMNGGVRIDTTFDLHLQQVAENRLRQELDHIELTKGYDHETYAAYHTRYSGLEEIVARGSFVNLPTPAYLQGAVLAIDNHTGGILALVGGRDFMHSEYNRALQGRRPPGTLFTPLVAAAAYNKGIFPGEVVDDSCMDNHYVMIGGETGILGEWGVECVDNDYEGPMTSHEAVARGKNAAVVRLGFLTGTDALEQFCTKAGIHSSVRDVANAYLGSSEMELDDLTLAYSLFPGEGSRPEKLYTIKKITDADGSLLFEAPLRRVDVVSPEVAFQTHSILDDSLHHTNAPEINNENLPFFPSGGKSGTSYDFTDVWFIGYSSEITCGVWLGFDKPQKIYRGAFGKNLALPVWAAVMNASLTTFPPKSITPPPTLHQVHICRSSGLLATDACYKANRVVTEYATDSEIPTRDCDVHGNASHKYTKDFEVEEWPRAVSAIDLAPIPSIAVTGSTLLASTDAYQALIPPLAAKSTDSNIPVAKAIAVDKSTTISDPKASLARSPELEKSNPKKKIIPIEKAIPVNPEVRRAQPVGPMDLPSALPVMNLSSPKPISFGE
jgi:penicillin-binding protein 1A